MPWKTPQGGVKRFSLSLVRSEVGDPFGVWPRNEIVCSCKESIVGRLRLRCMLYLIEKYRLLLGYQYSSGWIGRHRNYNNMEEFITIWGPLAVSTPGE